MNPFLTRRSAGALNIAALQMSAASLAQIPLEAGFRNPPQSAKPHTWWHWMDGNITREGLTADLEAMKRAGIGGAQMFHVSQGIPPGPVGYNSPQWRAMVVHAVKEANRLGLELCIHNCAGWSSSGGPWITPEHAMQVLAWSTKKVTGPARFDERLPPAKAPQVVKAIPFYRDICVLAFRTPSAPNAVEPIRQILGNTAVDRQDGIGIDTSPTPDGVAIPAPEVMVLTDKMDVNGRLTWDVPAGDWTILRIGHTPTGKDNHPAPPEGDGLEVDKLSREALDSHWNGMMAKVIAEVGPLAGKTLNNSLIDSYEVGSQNWTPKFREEFRKRRGYDLLPFLPAIAGYTVGSRETTSRFLWDFRRTIADLYADNYYGYFGDLCHKAGMKFSTEPYGNGLFDNIQAGGTADIPMGEFWIGGAAMETTKLASSIGHIYGRKYVGAESFTADVPHGRFIEEPYAIKALGDLAWCNGINRYIFHRYAHQPWLNLYPGMTMGPWGTHLERTETWWNQASAWLQYCARSQYLLQEGRFVADVLYFEGEGAPNDLPYRPNLRPQIPMGYDYDGCDANTVLNRATVRDGQIAIAGGMTYRMLVLPGTTFMTRALARKIKELVAQGATVVGPKPLQSPSLSGYPACDDEVRAIGEEVWGGVDGKTTTEHAFGRGRVIRGKPLEAVFASLNAPPDLEITANGAATKSAYIHRTIDGAEVYFVSNQQYSRADFTCTFRVAGRAPELWHPDTGVMESAPVYHEANGRTTVPLQLDPAGSVFVVFRRASVASHVTGVALRGAHTEETPAPNIRIVKARYETADGRGADVTEKVAAMVAGGQTEIPATNDAFGDPVPLTVKRLRVQYEIDGKPAEKMVAENESLMLVEESAGGGSAPAYEVATIGGQAALIPWKAGTYEIRMDNGGSRAVTAKSDASELRVDGPWQLRFPKGLGAPESAKFDNLMSWPESLVPGIKYFSGTATYSKEFSIPQQMVGSGLAVWLDLGKVKNFARVRLNGRDLGTLWKAPFRVNVAGIARAGTNRLDVEVTNLWPNRLIGDDRLPPDVEWRGEQLAKWPDWLVQHKPRPNTGRVTFTTWRYYTKDSPLLESGLLGPVTLQSAVVIPLR
jgi:hypothetical protein